MSDNPKFWIEMRAGCPTMVWPNGGCRDATQPELELSDYLASAQRENAALWERLRYIESQMHTNCSVSMDGMLRWSPRHTFRNLPGRTFAEAIDAALTTTAQGEAK